MDDMNFGNNEFEKKEPVSGNDTNSNYQAAGGNEFNANPYNEGEINEFNANTDTFSEAVEVTSQGGPSDIVQVSSVEAVSYNNTRSEENSGNSYGSNPGDSMKKGTFYTESVKKPRKTRNPSILQLVIVAVVSSMIGGTIVGSYFQFLAPAVQPSSKSFFSNFIGSSDNSNTSSGTNENAGTIKKVEIVQTEDSAVTAIAEKVSPSIVGIRVTYKTKSFIFDMSQEGKSEGSGIIIKPDGYIMTNYHVVKAAAESVRGSNAKLEVILPSQKDKPYEADIIGGDEKTDLAVIKINATNLPAVEFGNSDNLKIGELAVAIGNPAGLEYMGSVTVGVISGVNRTIPIDDGKELRLIQTDAAINPGNSGGALLNSKGQVIGINTAKIGENGYEGLGFAIPINKAKEITDSLMEFKYVKGRPLLGIESDPNFNEEVAKQYDVPMGVLVAQVTPFSGAYKGGIKAGDIITKFDGKAVKSVEEINELKVKHKPGDTVAVVVYRDGETLTLQVQLSEDKGVVKK
ncbi:S1C family serine protease [Pseudobacteroides cellulosolvens]|uniref:PDZ/DHR/GLGF domain protein n=1 Tax=Pseudobacteroides cellulosolvens ATCC 35603 = DSM 2933 TaxID=398512 RepID=A0A0L6JLA3_9FIRM|nr:trypsin-like peptidase domain-containing protein [Pseudobacteroides cellulosolvens]KNY26525.1 PDZ/DHR/GLGF domain protein [Pseudobacteroides cellulosolvens ATCC 35603 = DSM 2933]